MTFHPRAPASRMAHARHPLLRRLMMAFQPRSAQIARTRISRSDPNCLLLVGSFILALGLGGSILDALLPVEAAVLGRRPRSPGGVGYCSWMAVGSSPKEDEMELIRDSDASSGERGGATPVMQSMTRTRGVRGMEEEELLLEREPGVVPVRSSSSVASGWFRRLVRCIAVWL